MNKNTLLMLIGVGTLFLNACQQGAPTADAAAKTDSMSTAAATPAGDGKDQAAATPADPFADPIKSGLHGHLVEKAAKENGVGVISYGAGNGKEWSANNMVAKTLSTVAGEVLAAHTDLNSVNISIQDGSKKYVLNITRAELEKFLGTKLADASKNWTMDYIMKLPANKEARDKFFMQYVKTQ
jgi:hypothetical protein